MAIHTEAGLPVTRIGRNDSSKCDAITKKNWLCDNKATKYAETWIGTMMVVCSQHAQMRYNDSLRRRGALIAIS